MKSMASDSTTTIRFAGDRDKKIFHDWASTELVTTPKQPLLQTNSLAVNTGVAELHYPQFLYQASVAIIDEIKRLQRNSAVRTVMATAGNYNWSILLWTSAIIDAVLTGLASWQVNVNSNASWQYDSAHNWTDTNFNNPDNPYNGTWMGYGWGVALGVIGFVAFVVAAIWVCVCQSGTHSAIDQLPGNPKENKELAHLAERINLFVVREKDREFPKEYQLRKVSQYDAQLKLFGDFMARVQSDFQHNTQRKAPTDLFAVEPNYSPENFQALFKKVSEHIQKTPSYNALSHSFRMPGSVQ